MQGKYLFDINILIYVNWLILILFAYIYKENKY